MTPTFITSISPKHINMDQQIDAVKSWQVHGNVVSVNHQSEIDKLKEVFKDVQFITAARTAKPQFQKHYIFIDNLLNHAIDYEVAVIINSDIEITPDKKIISTMLSYSDKAFMYLHRWDYSLDKSTAKIYRDGVDAIVVNKSYIDKIPSSLFFLGSTHWDIWYPFAHYSAGCPLVSITSKPVIYHKKHAFQYDSKQWDTLGKHCAWLMGQPGISASQASERCYGILKATTNFI